MDTAILAAGRDENVDAVFILFALDADGVRAVAQHLFPVHADVHCALRLTVLHVGDLFQQSLFSLSQHVPFPSICLQQETVSRTIMG